MLRLNRRYPSPSARCKRLQRFTITGVAQRSGSGYLFSGMKYSTEHSKREELKTYHAIGLSREGKSRVGRRKAQQTGLYRYIGGDCLERPHLKVPREAYIRAWRESQIIIIEKWKSTVLETTAKAALMRPEIERLTYEKLAEEVGAIIAAETSFQQSEGRKMTLHEKALYGKTIQLSPHQKEDHSQMAQKRKLALNQVVQKIYDIHQGDQNQLQAAWASVIGSEKALDSILESIDDRTGIAFCRCTSTTLGFEIRRMRDLPAKLSKALGRKIQKILLK